MTGGTQWLLRSKCNAAGAAEDLMSVLVSRLTGGKMHQGICREHCFDVDSDRTQEKVKENHTV